jgi:syntaxin 8
MATPNPARLSAIGSKTLTLAMERQRVLSMSPPSQSLLSPAKTASSSSSLGQITKNMATLRDGIVAIEKAQGSSKAANGLREQYSGVLSVLGEEEAAAAGLERYALDTSMAIVAKC